VGVFVKFMHPVITKIRGLFWVGQTDDHLAQNHLFLHENREKLISLMI